MNTRVPPQLPSHVPTRLAFLGEAPAEDEILEGRPLVGPSGRVFNAVLRSAGLNREEFLVTNMFDEEFPNDKAIQAWREGGVDVERNKARLAAEFAITRPTVIVPMGAPALFALTGYSSISQMRGAVMLASVLSRGTKIVPTYHPAHIIRQWQLFAVLIGDVQRAAREADRGPLIYPPKRELLLEPSIADIRQYVPRLLASNLLSADIETALGEITCIGFAPDAEHAICIPFVDQRVPSRSYWHTPMDEAQAWHYVKEVLESDTPKLGQNYSSYDAFWLYDKRGIVTCNLRHDDRLLHHALYPELPKSLAFMGASYANQGAWKHWGHRKGEKRDD